MGMQVLPGQAAGGCSQPPKEPQHLQNPPPKKSVEHWCAPRHGQEPGTDGHGREHARLQALPGIPKGSTGFGDQMNGSCPGDPHDLFGSKNGSWAP